MERRDVLAIVLLVALGLVGLSVFLHFYTQAFPAASLDFKLSREDAYRAAQNYLEGQGHNPEGYESAQVFSWAQMSQIFLEQTLGLEETNRLARDWVSIWSWRVRWFKPLEKEEYRVELDPGGRVVGFDHRILESDEGASLDQDAARDIASRFLRESQGFNLAEYELIEQSTKERKARVDHTYSYRKRGFTVGDDGHYRLTVVVKGDQLGAFREGVKVPESFSRNYAEIRSRADLLTSSFGVFWVALAVAALVILLQFYRKGLLDWQPGLVIGGLVVIASIVGVINSLPLILYSFNTTQSYAAFMAMMLAVMVLISVLQGGVIASVGTSGNAVGRQTLHGGLLSPLGRIRFGGILSRGFLRSTLVGYGIAGGMIGYITIFYLIGTRYFGLYAPADVSDYNNAFSTVLPWIYPLLAGLTAATLEEFFFRLLAISLLVRWLKRPWLAVLISAVVWAFLHSNYPVEPIYMRGIELIPVGILFGVAFLRFGIWAPIIAHYAYNAFLTAFPMIKSSSLYFQVSGIAITAILLLPAIPALVAVLMGRSRDEAEEPQEADIPQPVETPEAPKVDVLPDDIDHEDQDEAPPCKDLSAYIPGRRELMIACVLAAVGLLMMIGFRTERFGARTLSMSVTRSEAVETAEAFCLEVGFDTQDCRRSVKYQSYVGSDDFVHLVRQAGVARADSLMYENTGPWLWNVRWFKALEKEEIVVGVDATGNRVLYFDHKLPESKPGSEMEVDSARGLAEVFAASRFGKVLNDQDRYKLLEAESEKREARLDHNFVWERVDQKVDDGEFRVEIRVQGDEVGRLLLRYKAPEAFLRDLKEKTARDVIAILVPVLLVIATLTMGVIYFFRAYRDGLVVWRFPLLAGLAMAGITVVNRINGLPTFYQGYNTSESMGTFLGGQAIALLMGTVFGGLALAVALALLLALYRSRFPDEMAPDRWLSTLPLRKGNARFWAGTLVLALAFASCRSGVGQLAVFVRYNWFLEYLTPGGYALDRVNYYLICLSGITDGIYAFLMPLLVMTLILIWLKMMRKEWVVILALGLAATVLPAATKGESLEHFALLLGTSLVGFLPILYLIVRVIRFNLMAYMIGSWAGRVVFGPGLAFFQETTIASVKIDAAILLLIGLTPLILPLIAWLRGRRSASP
jgi:membrane protease YdiL (CAAX protease family)